MKHLYFKFAAVRKSLNVFMAATHSSRFVRMCGRALLRLPKEQNRVDKIVDEVFRLGDVAVNVDQLFFASDPFTFSELSCVHDSCFTSVTPAERRKVCICMGEGQVRGR